VFILEHTSHGNLLLLSVGYLAMRSWQAVTEQDNSTLTDNSILGHGRCFSVTSPHRTRKELKLRPRGFQAFHQTQYHDTAATIRCCHCSVILCAKAFMCIVASTVFGPWPWWQRPACGLPNEGQAIEFTPSRPSLPLPPFTTIPSSNFWWLAPSTFQRPKTLALAIVVKVVF
jgi:hypothetical protein